MDASFRFDSSKSCRSCRTSPSLLSTFVSFGGCISSGDANLFDLFFANLLFFGVFDFLDGAVGVPSGVFVAFGDDVIAAGSGGTIEYDPIGRGGGGVAEYFRTKF